MSSILREKDKWLSIDSDMPKLSLKKQRPPAWPQLEESYKYGWIKLFAMIVLFLGIL